MVSMPEHTPAPKSGGRERGSRSWRRGGSSNKRKSGDKEWKDPDEMYGEWWWCDNGSQWQYSEFQLMSTAKKKEAKARVAAKKQAKLKEEM